MVTGIKAGKVSIIVVNWNGVSYLEDCLRCLSSQSYANREIILVDNGSSDSSVPFVRQRFPDVEILELGKNTGFTGGNLAGLNIADGEFIALVNNDARVQQGWLENLVKPMLEDRKVGICASKLIIDGMNKLNSAGDGITTAAVGFNRGLWAHDSLYNAPEPVFSACGAAVLYRRRMLDEIGFLDEDFFLYDDDTDLSFRAHLAGWDCVYVPAAVAYHKVNATSVRLSDLQVYYHTRNLEFVWIKNMPTGLMLRFAHHKLIQEIGAFCYLCIRHTKWRAFFRAKRDALKMLPAMLKKRAQIQRGRRVSNRHIKEQLTSIFSAAMIRQKLAQFIRG